MTLVRISPRFCVGLATRDRQLAKLVERAMHGTQANALPGNPGEVAVVDIDHFGSTGSSDLGVILVEIGGGQSLDLFREALGKFPDTPIVTLCRPEDADLVEVAAQHGADEAVFTSEISQPILKRVLLHARERHHLARQLLSAREREASLSTHDGVTGLANRSLFFNWLNRAIRQSQQTEEDVAVVAMRLSGLGPLNDRFGFEAGDRILSILGERLSDKLRTSDLSGRLGGSEFLMFLRSAGTPSNIGRTLTAISEALSEPIYVAGQGVETKTQFGVALYPHDAVTAESLVASAHRALRYAREQQGHYVFAAANPIHVTPDAATN